MTLKSLLTGGLAAAFLLTAAQAPAWAKDKLEVVTSTTGVLFGTAYIAKKLGYFDEVGLDVSIYDGNGGSNAVAAIVGGSAQIGIVGLKNMSQAVLKGQSLKAIGTGVQGFPNALVVRSELLKDAKVNADSSLADKGAVLRDRVIAVTDIGGSSGEFARFILKQAGLPADKATIINLNSIAGQLASLKAGKIDAFVNGSPTIETAVRDGYGTALVVPSRDLKDITAFEYTVQAVRADFLKQNPDIVERYLKALDKAIKVSRNDPEKAKAAVFAFLAEQASTDNAYPAEIQDLAWTNTLAYFPTSVALDDAKLTASRAFFGVSETLDNAALTDNTIARKVAGQ